MFDRCPSFGDIGQVLGPDVCQVSQFWGHRAGIGPGCLPGVPVLGTSGWFWTLMFDRCPCFWDIGQVLGPDVCQVSQFWGHRAGIGPGCLPGVPVLGTSGWFWTLMFDRCPCFWDIGQVLGPDVCLVSQFEGHRAGFRLGCLPGVFP